MNELSVLFENYPELAYLKNEICLSIDILVNCFKNGGKLLVCGNGGSAADSEHIVGELMKGFILKREVTDLNIPVELAENLQGALPAIALTGAISLSTAFANDVNPDFIFAQQVYGLGNPGDVFMGISTSGNAKNINCATQVAKAKGLKTIALTGVKDSALSRICDVTIKVPSNQTYRIQEYHLPVYHAICAIVESKFFAEICSD